MDRSVGGSVGGSAYRKGHSTETALLKIFSDILDAADSAQVTLL